MMKIREQKGFDAATCWANFDRAEREKQIANGVEIEEEVEEIRLKCIYSCKCKLNYPEM